MGNINWSIALRPTKFSQVYGLDKLKTFAYKAAKKSEWPVGIMLQGTTGTGKTTAAKIIAQMMVCTNLTPEGESCCECPSCKAIINETWSRDVINLDGARDDSAKIKEQLESFTLTAPMRDKKKVVIIDEVQNCSAACKASLLKMLETKRDNVHFIFTAMTSMAGGAESSAAAVKALMNRCMVFKYPNLTTIDIIKYLYSIVKSQAIEATNEFKTYGLKMIAESSEQSLRKAVMTLQQCVETETYDLEEIKANFGVANIEDFYATLLRLLDGEKSDELFETLLNVNDYDGMIRLSVLAIANAETYRLFGHLNEYNGNGKKKDQVDDELISLFDSVSKSKADAKTMSDWQMNHTIAQIKPLIAHKNYAKVRDLFMEFYKDNSIYSTKASYILGMTKIISACRGESVSTTPQRIVESSPAPAAAPQPAAPVGRRIIKND